MSKVIPFKKPELDKSAIREQAAQWLSRLDVGATESELKAIDEWLEENPAHLEVFMEMASLWDQMSMLDELSTVFPLKEYAPPSSSKSLQHRNRMLLAGASLAIFLVTFFGSVTNLLNNKNSDINYQAHYETAVGEQLTIDLIDGSQIILNTDSSLNVDLNKSTRKLTLNQGEGLFKVAKDSSRPFQVFAGNQMVEAVGTAFSVLANNNELEVMVTEGKVMLHQQRVLESADINSTSEPAQEAESSNRVPLTAGQYAAFSELTNNMVRLEMDSDQIEAKLSWQHGMLLFRDDPLEQVLKEVSRYTTVNIEASDAVSHIRVGGYFRVNDYEGFLNAIENNFQINIQRTDNNNIYLIPR